MAAGKFPSPIPVACHRAGWIQSEIDAWIDGRIQSGRAERARYAEETAGA